MNEQDFRNFLMEPPSLEQSRALEMILRHLFLRADTGLTARLAGVTELPANVHEVKKEHNPLIEICYHPSLIAEETFLEKISSNVLYQKWLEFRDNCRKEFEENEERRSKKSDYRLQSRPFRMRYELYTEPQYAFDLINHLVYSGDLETSVYFRVEDPSAEVGWNWPLRISFLPDEDSVSLFENLKAYINGEEWLRPLVDLVCLDSENDSCDLLLIPAGIREARDKLKLGIRISADCVVAIGLTTESDEEIPLLIQEFRNIFSTAGIGIAPVDPPSLGKWFETLIRELSHNEPIDVALFSASMKYGLRPPFLMASRKLIEFSKLAESIKSIGEELLNAEPEAKPVSISSDDAKVFGVEPGNYHPRDVGKIFKSGTDNFTFDQERRSGTRSIDLSKLARRSMNKSKKPEKTELRWIQAVVYELLGDKAPIKLDRFLYADAPHKVVVRIGTEEDGWLQNREKFSPKELSDKKTYILTVIFTESQLLEQPLVSFIELPPQGNSTECEFKFQVPKGIEKIEGRISIVYKNRVLQTAILKADVVADAARAMRDARIELVPEAIVRADLSDLKNRRNFDGAFILNHDTGNVPGLTAIKDRYVSFSSLGELDDFVSRVDEFITKVADYPEDYEGQLDTSHTVTLLCDLAKHGRILHQALAEFPQGNMKEIFDELSPEDPKIIQRIQVISTKSDTRLPIEFLYDRTAPASNDAKLCPKAVEGLKQGKCFSDCDGMKDKAGHVCPVGFWGLSKIIERHKYSDDHGKRADESFRFHSDPIEGRKHLDIFRRVLFGASDRADLIQSTSVNKLKKGGVRKIISVLNKITNSANNQKIASWKEWRDEINGTPSPTALLLLTHTEIRDGMPALEIEQGELVEMQSIEKEYVSLRKDSPPIVFLIGCETGAADIKFMNFVSKFRIGGAAIIVSTGSPILGRHAVPVTSELLSQLKKFSDQPNTSFGEVMRRVKQNMLADGFPMVLTLMTYGDADWQIGK